MASKLPFKHLLIVFAFYVVFSMFVHAEEIESTNFVIKGDNLSSGSGSGNSSNYGMVGDINPFSDLSDSTNFRQELGYVPRLEVSTPRPATLQNSEEYYDRLLIILDNSDNPSDTLFAVAISDDNFSSYKYVQNDGTVGDSLGTEDYRTYVSWGDTSGSYILGLDQSTTYKVRVKALQGDFTDTGYSSDSNEATTTVPYVSMTVSESALTFGILNINSISQTSTMAVTVNSNAYSGYQVYVNDTGDGVSGGLYNGSNSLIESQDQTLVSGFEGYGAQASSLTASIDASYNVTGNNVGGLDISSSGIFSNSQAVNGESTNVTFKAAMSPNTTAGNYTDIVYFTVTPNL